MKAVIMAGGYATRLWPITKSKSKPLLPVGKKRIIDHIYDKIIQFKIPVIVSTNRRFEEDFSEWISGKDAELVIEETKKEEEKLGAVRALLMVAKKVNDEMLILAGDNLFSFQLDGLLGYYKKHKTAVTALFDVGNPELAKRYGVAELNGDRILNFVEKPEKPSSTLVGVGIYVFPRKVTGILEEYVGTNPKSDNLGDFLSYLCQNEEVRGYTFDNGNWYDVGNPDSYIDAFKIFMEHSLSEKANIDSLSKIIQPVTIETGTKIIGRSIIGPFAYIGKNCVIENSDVSDTVVFDEVVLRKVKMWRSIVDECCEIRNLELNSSIIGGHAKIQRGE